MPSLPFSALVFCLLAIAPLAAEQYGPNQHNAPAADRPKPSPWATTYDYGKATAHEPNYADKKLWPYLSGKEYFLKTTFPKTKVLRWAHPGKDAGEGKPLDPLDPKNWLDEATGQPSTTPPDLTTDVIMPASETYYMVDFQNPGHGKKNGVKFTARCVTVGANANLSAGDARTTGNVWVRRGGFFMVDVNHFFEGSANTFYRNENDREKEKSGPGGEGCYVCQYFNLKKATKEASVEILGNAFTVDEFQLFSGTLIIGQDSVVEPGREAYPYIEKDAVLAIMDGGYFGKWVLDYHCYDLDVRGGTLLGGLPDRPLTRNATLRIGFKNYTNTQYGKPKDKGGQPVHKFARQPGIMLKPGSVVRSHSTDLAKARLVIAAIPDTYMITFCRPPLGTDWVRKESEKDPMRKAFYDWLAALPKGIDMIVEKGAVIDGVELDGFRKGGLMVREPGLEKEWKNVFYGKGNLAPPAELVGQPYGKGD